MKLGEAMYKAQAAEQPPMRRPRPAVPAGGHPGGGKPDEKVVDAEFEEVDEKKKKSA